MKNLFHLDHTATSKLTYHKHSKATIKSYFDKTGVFCIELLSPIVVGVIWYDQNDCTYYYRTMTPLYNELQLIWFLEEFTYCNYEEIAQILETPNTNIEIYYKGGNSYV